MATPVKQNFIIKGNSQWERVWTFATDGLPLNISTYSFELEIKTARGPNAKSILDLTMNNGITFEDAAGGTIRIVIPPQTQITQTISYVYDFILIKNSKRYNILEGTMTFDPGVTY